MNRSQERKQFLFDVFVTAIEGGINYWSQVTDYAPFTADGKEDLDGFYATIFEVGDGDEHKEWRIDIATISQGVSRMKGSADLNLAIRTNGKEGDFDAADADVIVQLGLFGEEVYG